MSGFNIYQYEAITVGLQSIYESLLDGSYDIEMLKRNLMKAKKDLSLKKATVGGGKNSPGVYKIRKERVIEILKETKNI